MSDYWEFLRGRGDAGIEDTSEDPRGDPSPKVEPEPTRDYFAEAVSIAAGPFYLLPQKEHIAAVIERLDDAESELRRLKLACQTLDDVPPIQPHQVADAMAESPIDLSEMWGR